MSSEYHFKKHPLSAAERLWLEEAARFDFSPRRGIERLHGKIPNDFRPSLIDSRLYSGSKIMPIGLWHADPAHPALQVLDKVICAIRNRIPTEDLHVTFTAAAIAREIGAEEAAAARAFQHLMDFGAGFFNTGRELPNGAGLQSIDFNKGNLFEYYRQYNGIEDLLERAYTRQGKDLYAPDSYVHGLVASASSQDIGSRLMQVLQLYEASTQAEDTVVLKGASHEQLTKAINSFVFHHGARLGIAGWGDNLQSLRDGGVDSIWRASMGANLMKFGFQVKSWGDINDSETSLRSKVLTQISESRQMDLSCLFVALAADLTSGSQAQKARQLMAEIERFKDGYAYAISPEKTLAIWNWMRRTNFSALEQNRAAGYAALTVVFDSLGNRTHESAVQGNTETVPSATTVRAGDLVNFTAVAYPERAEPLEFQFALQRSGRTFETHQDWSKSATWTWCISTQDIGKGVFVKIATRRPKTYYQYCGDADDYVSLSYDVLPVVH